MACVLAQANPPQNLHHKAMVLWVSTYLDGFMTKVEQKTTVKEWLTGNSRTAAGPRQPRRLETRDGHEQTTRQRRLRRGFTIFVCGRPAFPQRPPSSRHRCSIEPARVAAGSRARSSMTRTSTTRHIGSAFAVMAIRRATTRVSAKRARLEHEGAATNSPGEAQRRPGKNGKSWVRPVRAKQRAKVSPFRARLRATRQPRAACACLGCFVAGLRCEMLTSVCGLSFVTTQLKK